MTHPRFCTLLLLTTSLLGIAGCGSSVVAADGAGGSSAACKLDPAGSTFVFHVKNTGTTARSLNYGCGSVPSMVLATPGGMDTIQPFDLSFCGFTCEQFYEGQPPLANTEGCSDCGPGYGADLPPGATVDVKWDRRVYTEQSADPQCVGGMTGLSCALGVAVAPTTTQAGVLTVCPQDLPSSAGGPGSCSAATFTVAFTLDTMQSEGTIEVQ